MSATELSVANHLLIAMPTLEDPNFEHTVIYVCEHHALGAVGLIINRPMPYPLGLVFQQLHIENVSHEKEKLPLLFGGPVQPERGFVLHRPFGTWQSSLLLQDGVSVTTSNDIIRAIAKDIGPKDPLIALGYVGWSEGQLDKELMGNHWLVCSKAPEALLYELPYHLRWQAAGELIGVNMQTLSHFTGHA